MKIIKKKLSELKPAPYNPRINVKDNPEFYKKLKNSIDKFGLVEPIVWNQRTDHIVGGHQRYELLKNENIDLEVDVVVVDLDLNDEKALNIALNKITGDWDVEKLNSIINSLNNELYDVKLTGFSLDEINKILDEMNPDKKEKFDVEKALERAPKYKVDVGDVFMLGNHRLMCGDAVKDEDMQKLMGKQCADMVITDPPYNVNYGSVFGHPSWKRTQPKDKKVYVNKNRGHPYWENRKEKGIGNAVEFITNDNLSEEDWIKFVEGYMQNILKYCKGAIYVFMSNKEMYSNKNIFEKLGGHWASFIIWNKNHFVLGLQDYQRQYEPILYGWKDGTKRYWCGDRNQSDIWMVDRPVSSPDHPIMKPIDLCVKAIKNSSLRDNIVLDLFGGSGSTLIACEKTKRKCFMMEIEPFYCSVIIERWEAFSNSSHQKI